MEFDAEWVHNLLGAVVAETHGEAQERIFSRCSEMCTREWASKAAAVRAQTPDKSDAALLEAFRHVLPGDAPEVSIRDVVIFWQFSGGDCPCPIARLVRSPVLCRCGAAHVRGMLEPLLGRPLSVKLLRSRLGGDGECAFAITPTERKT
jgi:hypothetical protein